MSDPREQQRYCASFCEENVWHLADALGPERCEVLLIGNADRKVVMWGQRAAAAPQQPVLWDYHVVLLRHEDDRPRIYDLDTVLGWPLPLDLYLAGSFQLPPGQQPQLQPRFRVIDAAAYRQRLSSDRSHMRDAEGAWLQPPPPWPAIDGEPPASLMRLIDLDDDLLGEVIGLETLRARSQAGR